MTGLFEKSGSTGLPINKGTVVAAALLVILFVLWWMFGYGYEVVPAGKTIMTALP